MYRENRNTTKALQVMVDKVKKFDGRGITKFLKIFTYKMDVYQVSKMKMITTFDLAVIPKIKEKVHELHTKAIS